MKSRSEAARTILSRLMRLCVFMVVLCGMSNAASAALINEIRIYHSGGGIVDFFELKGAPSEDLNEMTYVVLGHGTTDGEITHVYPLAGYSIAAAKQHIAFVSSDWSANTSHQQFDHVYPGLDFTPGIYPDYISQTHLLVRNFTGTLGQDLDTNDDGDLDLTPWQDVLDSVGLPMDVGATYSSVIVSRPRSSFPHNLVFRPSDGDQWECYSTGGVGFQRDTPGLPNTARNTPPHSVTVTPRVAFMNSGSYPYGTILANLTGFDHENRQIYSWEFDPESLPTGYIYESNRQVGFYPDGGVLPPIPSGDRYDFVIKASDLDDVSTTIPFTVLVPGDGGEVVYPVDSQSVGTLLPLGPSGISVRFLQVDQPTGFALHVRRVDAAATGTLSPTGAQASNGTTVTPTRISPDRYWIVEPVGITAPVSYNISFDISTMPGVYEPDSVVLMKHSTPSQPWTAVDTTHDNGVLTASGLTSFSEFTVGGLQGTLVPVAISGFSLE